MIEVKCPNCDIRVLLDRVENDPRHVKTVHWLCAECNQVGVIVMALPLSMSSERLEKIAELTALLEKQGMPSMPIPMIILCVSCGQQHIDEEEWATRPHKTHLCKFCGTCWRVAAVATVGVAHKPCQFD